MADNVVLLSIPGLRPQDVADMPNLKKMTDGGDRAPLVPSFPAVTWPVQSNMLTGTLPVDHGVTANGLYHRDRGEVEMWTMGNKALQKPQIWDILRRHQPETSSAAWFPMLSKNCGADYVCMPAPIHNPDGSESLWCYTKPTELYGEFLDSLGHFPLHNFWGPLSSVVSTEWIARSAIQAAHKFRPNFFYVYLTHLDYAPQKMGPDSDDTKKAIVALDNVLGELFTEFQAAYQGQPLLFLIASEYTIVPVDHVTYPNRVLRQAGLLSLDTRDGLEYLNYGQSAAWALADHQFSHVYVKDQDPAVIQQVSDLFRGKEGIDEVLAMDQRQKYFMNHPNSGEVILISTPNSWQAYYWWEDDAKAPSFARTVDIHRKPGYDPVEMHLDFATKSIPLDATLVSGSHGAPARAENQRGVLLSSQSGVYPETPLADTDVCDLVLKQFNI